MTIIKVALDKTPTISAHSTRGIGSYTANLITELKKRQDLELVLFDNPKSPPLADIVHYPYFDLFTSSLPQKKKSKTIVTIHDVIPLMFPKEYPIGVKGRARLFLQKIALKSCDGVICDSEQSKTDVVNKLSFAESKVHVAYLAAASDFKMINDKKSLNAVSKKYNLPQKFVLYVGDVNWNKNIPNLLKAVAICKCNLVLVGGAFLNSSLRETAGINNLIENLNLTQRIIKTGFVDNKELAAIYNLAQSTLMPSFYEGFGLPVLESMSSGTPVICSNNSSLKEITDDAAIYCDPKNPSDIAEKITLVLKLPQNDKTILQQKGIQNASRSSWQKTAQNTVEIYKKIISD